MGYFYNNIVCKLPLLVRAPGLKAGKELALYTRYPFVERALGLKAAECVARAKVSYIQWARRFIFAII